MPSSSLSECEHIASSHYRHPELHSDEILAIKDMFDEAKQKGWLK